MCSNNGHVWDQAFYRVVVSSLEGLGVGGLRLCTLLMLPISPDNDLHRRRNRGGGPCPPTFHQNCAKTTFNMHKMNMHHSYGLGPLQPSEFSYTPGWGGGGGGVLCQKQEEKASFVNSRQIARIYTWSIAEPRLMLTHSLSSDSWFS